MINISRGKTFQEHWDIAHRQAGGQGKALSQNHDSRSLLTLTLDLFNMQRDGDGGGTGVRGGGGVKSSSVEKK